MGITDILRDGSVYLDTNVFIYALEGYSDYARVLDELFEAVDSGHLRAVTSELTVAEALVKPMMDGNRELQETYESVLQDSDHLRIVPVSRRILVSAARMRAANNTLKLPDAIHAATAQDNGCKALLTNDRKMSAVAEMRVILLSEVASTEVPDSTSEDGHQEGDSLQMDAPS